MVVVAQQLDLPAGRQGVKVYVFRIHSQKFKGWNILYRSNE